MSQPNLTQVNTGLTVAHWGFRLVAGGVVIPFVLVVLSALSGMMYGTLNFQYTWLVFTVLGISMIGAGLLVGFFGRMGCLATPADLPVSRVRIRLAVTLEGCGWLSGVVNVGIAGANSSGSIDLPVEVLCGVFLFAFTLFVAGRAFFYAFTVALAKAVGMKPAPLPSVVAMMVIITSSTIVASAVGLQLVGSSRALTLTELLIISGAFAATLCTFGTMYAIGRWYQRLREAVTQFNARPVEHVEG